MCLLQLAYYVIVTVVFFFFKQKTAYEMRISDWSSDVCSSDLLDLGRDPRLGGGPGRQPVDLAQGDACLGQGGTRPDHDPPLPRIEPHHVERQIGRASCRERVCQYV